jgi:hypothetical protein
MAASSVPVPGRRGGTDRNPDDDRPSSTGSVLAAAVPALLGIGIALAATWPATVMQPEAPSRVLALHPPEWLLGIVMLAMIAVFLAIVSSLIPSRRRKDPDDFELEPPPPPRISPLVLILLLGLMIAGVAGVVWVLWHFDWSQYAGAGRQAGPPDHLAPTVPPRAPAAETVHAPVIEFGLTFTVTAVALAVIAFAFWLLSQNRWLLVGRGHRRRRRVVQLAAELASAVRGGIDDISANTDPRAAIIACYRRCEQAVTEHRHRRYPWQTPREFLFGALRALALPPDPVASLMAVFERARFDQSPVTQEDRTTALQALYAIRGALARRSEEHGPVA